MKQAKSFEANSWLEKLLAASIQNCLGWLPYKGAPQPARAKAKIHPSTIHPTEKILKKQATKLE